MDSGGPARQRTALEKDRGRHRPWGAAAAVVAAVVAAAAAAA